MRFAPLGLTLLLACGGDDGSAIVPDAAPACTNATIFLNPNGGAYTGGPDDATTNTTQILGNPATFGAAGLPSGTWTTLLACIAEKFAPFAVEVTDVDPGATPHLEVVFVPEAEWSMTGLPSGVSVVSAFAGDCVPLASPVILYNLAYDDDESLCWLAAQGLATSQGLDHAFHCPDLLSYTSGCGEKTFVDMDVPCGENEARPCTCGNETQNSYQHLGGVFGFSCE